MSKPLPSDVGTDAASTIICAIQAEREIISGALEALRADDTAARRDDCDVLRLDMSIIGAAIRLGMVRDVATLPFLHASYNRVAQACTLLANEIQEQWPSRGTAGELDESYSTLAQAAEDFCTGVAFACAGSVPHEELGWVHAALAEYFA